MLTRAGQFPFASGRVRLDDAIAWIDALPAPVRSEDVTLAAAAGHVLAGDVTAGLDLPPFDRTAADGFALRADETVGAGAYSPLPFRLVPASAGVQAGEAAAVECGDRLPAGADAVVRLEHATLDAPGAVAIIAPVAAGNEVERAGSHAVSGNRLVAAGRELRPGDVGLLASAGVERVSVVGRLRVCCLLAADRVSEPGQGPGQGLVPGTVHDANGPMLAVLVERDGGAIVEQRRVERNRAALRDALGPAGADVVLVAGGTGPGAGDAAAATLAEAGELAFHGVALRPGETAGAGRASGAPVFLLPGTPAACLWAYELLAGRAIRRMAGRDPELPFVTREMRLARKIVSEIGTTEVCPVRCTQDGEAEPIAPFAEAGLVAAAQGDGFVIVPEVSEGYPQGAPVMVHLYSGRGQTPRATSVVQHQARERGV